jgi:hypothetical protein
MISGKERVTISIKIVEKERDKLLNLIAREKKRIIKEMLADKEHSPEWYLECAYEWFEEELQEAFDIENCEE